MLIDTKATTLQVYILFSPFLYSTIHVCIKDWDRVSSVFLNITAGLPSTPITISIPAITM